MTYEEWCEENDVKPTDDGRAAFLGGGRSLAYDIASLFGLSVDFDTADRFIRKIAEQ